MAHRGSIRLIGALALVAGLAAACSSSSSSSTTTSTPKVGTGTLTCNSITGTIAFAPPLTNSGTKAETTRVTLTASGCATSGSNIPSITAGHGTATITDNNNSCAAITTSKPVKVSIVWTPSSVQSTTVSYSGYKVAANTSGQYGFTLPDTGGSATVAGSFGGSGSTATAATYSTSTAAQIATACASSAGLAVLTLGTGSVTIG